MCASQGRDAPHVGVRGGGGGGGGGGGAAVIFTTSRILKTYPFQPSSPNRKFRNNGVIKLKLI